MRNNFAAYLSIAGEAARKQYSKDRREAVKIAAQNQGLQEFLAACRKTAVAKKNSVFAAELSALATANVESLEAERLARVAKREAKRSAAHAEQMRILRLLGRSTYASVYGTDALEKLDKSEALALVAGRNRRKASRAAAKGQQARDEALVGVA